MKFDSSQQMKQELWQSAGDEAERTLPKNVTDDLLLKVEKGQHIAALMTMPGWEVLEKILYKELQFGQMIEDSAANKLDVAQTYRVGIMMGVLKRIYLLPQIAEKAKRILDEDAKRRDRHGKRREARRERGGIARKRIWFGRGGERETT